MGAGGNRPFPQIWAGELTLFQEGGADYAHKITNPPPLQGFQTFLRPRRATLEAPKAPIVPPSPYFTF